MSRDTYRARIIRHLSDGIARSADDLMTEVGRGKKSILAVITEMHRVSKELVVVEKKGYTRLYGLNKKMFGTRGDSETRSLIRTGTNPFDIEAYYNPWMQPATTLRGRAY